MKIKLENICEMRVTLKSNYNGVFIIIDPKEFYVFESEEKLNEFSESVRGMVFSKFLKKIEDFKDTKPVTGDAPINDNIDEDLVSAIKNIKKEINDLKKEFKATDVKEEKRSIKAKIKELNDTIKTLSK